MTNNKGLTEALALDCEMVGAGQNGSISIVARVSIVNEYFCCVYDTYVMPRRPVTDYRTFVSGIQPQHLKNGIPFEEVKTDVATRLRGRILIGHSVEKDLRVLGLCHPEWNIRDTAHYYRFQTPRGKPSLKNLAARFTDMKIQEGAHCSIRDARATMKIYKRFEQEWEDELYESDSSTSEESEVSDSYYYY